MSKNTKPNVSYGVMGDWIRKLTKSGQEGIDMRKSLLKLVILSGILLFSCVGASSFLVGPLAFFAREFMKVHIRHLMLQPRRFSDSPRTA